MSRQVVLLVRCDVCDVAADEEHPVEEGIPITFDKVVREIDLCATCREQAADAIGAWLDSARKPPKQAAAKRGLVKKAAVPRAQKRVAPPKVPCPTCKKPFDPLGLPIHRARKHGYRRKR